MGVVLDRIGVSIERAAAGTLYRGLTLAAKSPTLSVWLARLGRYGHPLADDTDVVIEGFPRSGNSFAVAAIHHAQPRPVRVAHHLHAPGHVIAAVRASIPTLVVIRHPDEAVPEFAGSKPNLSVRAIVRGYLRFYEPLLRHRSGFVIAAFDELMSDFGSVIGRINERFGTDFASFEPTESNLRSVHQAVDRDYERRRGSAPTLLGTSNDRSAPADDTAADRSRREYEKSDVATLRGRARTVYEEFVGNRR